MAKTAVKPTAPPARKAKRPLPKTITPALAHAVLEDAMLEAAADIAALSATLDASVAASPAAPPAPLMAAQTPEEAQILELVGVPFLGPTRAQALAAAGIRTLDDLRAASPGDIGGVKGVGMGNAARIKDWLAAQPAPSSAPPSAAPPAPAALPADAHLASLNQDVQDLFARLDNATGLLKTSLSPGGGMKRLARQLAKLDGTASELAEGPDMLSPKQVQRAVRMLDKAAAILEGAAGKGRLSPKKQDALADDLRGRRKELEKVLGG